MNQTIKALCNFFEDAIPNLPESYHWKVPEIAGFEPSKTSNYHDNIELKHYLHEQWIPASHERRCEIARIIVSDWGGIRGNNEETLAGYVAAIDQQNPETPLKGIASYSKIFSIARPDQYAIYDARVAACLNAVQLNAGIKKGGVCFNYVPGRNNIVGRFTRTPQFSKEALTGAGWLGLEKNETYEKYNEVLSICLEELKNKKHYERYELEMALFAKAEDECKNQLIKVGAIVVDPNSQTAI